MTNEWRKSASVPLCMNKGDSHSFHCVRMKESYESYNEALERIKEQCLRQESSILENRFRLIQGRPAVSHFSCKITPRKVQRGEKRWQGTVEVNLEDAEKRHSKKYVKLIIQEWELTSLQLVCTKDSLWALIYFFDYELLNDKYPWWRPMVYVVYRWCCTVNQTRKQVNKMLELWRKAFESNRLKISDQDQIYGVQI